ncbi:MAG: hypothetical protein KDI67_02550 [Gammaproteobacteria bacterium]|nr:hypothetical protein [Gammaproteobacteria bacterium]MCP5414806.1 hypothetical protein [Chromatiaceae bacterium]MCP5436835.1 hypothetical protein [Chromatiaceae bacterium]MCP5441117.1 hypothetical protein [Chromatiaceae bacterium]HPE80865.1 hypothetical protein [Gammaproteobacteria bacterium]
MFIQRTNCRCILLPMLVLIVSASVGAESGGVVSTKDPATGLLSWKYEGDGLGIELLQVPPDFIRASYSARDLPATVSEAVATRCVFGTIVRNISEKPLQYRVQDWRYKAADGVEKPIKTKSEWLEEWHGMGVRFSWSILADDSVFEVGDWIQGFTTMPEPHGSVVDLLVVWSIGGVRYEKWLPNLQCAPAPLPG